MSFDLAEDLGALVSSCLELRDHLQTAKRLVDEQIRDYPKPIPRCDAQFNYLYEQRDRLSAALDRTNAALASQPSTAALVGVLMDVLASAPWSDDEVERDLRTRLHDRIEGRHGHTQRFFLE